jgi:hypothetical protein
MLRRVSARRGSAGAQLAVAHTVKRPVIVTSDVSIDV